MERVILKARIVDALDFRQLLALAGEPECGLGLPTEADVERVEAKGLHIRHLRRHQRTEVGHQFGLYTRSKCQRITYPLCTLL